MPRPVSGSPSLTPLFGDPDVADRGEFQSAAEGVTGQGPRSAARVIGRGPRTRDVPPASSPATSRAAAGPPRRQCRPRRRKPCPRQSISRPGLPTPRRLPAPPREKRADHGEVERVELVGAPEREPREDGPSNARSTCALIAPPPRRRAASRPNGFGMKQSGRPPARRCSPTFKRKPACASTSRSRSTPGASSTTVTPSRSRRMTHRSVT